MDSPLIIPISRFANANKKLEIIKFKKKILNSTRNPIKKIGKNPNKEKS
tara:strand:+ start:145 stop:291 length:147 start_codon:yes stop_codon:yes gene_type:complete